jgi:hypothetical protein
MRAHRETQKKREMEMEREGGDRQGEEREREREREICSRGRIFRQFTSGAFRIHHGKFPENSGFI